MEEARESTDLLASRELDVVKLGWVVEGMERKERGGMFFLSITSAGEIRMKRALSRERDLLDDPVTYQWKEIVAEDVSIDNWLQLVTCWGEEVAWSSSGTSEDLETDE